MLGESGFAGGALLLAAGLWAGLTANHNRRLLRAPGEVVSLRPARWGQAEAPHFPTVGFHVEGEYQEVELREAGLLSIGDDVDVLYPPGRPDQASLKRRPYRGPIVLLLLALSSIAAALSR